MNYAKNILHQILQLSRDPLLQEFALHHSEYVIPSEFNRMIAISCETGLNSVASFFYVLQFSIVLRWKMFKDK